MQVTIETKAYLSDSSNVTPDQLQTPEGARHLSFFKSDMTGYSYTYIGPATVTVDVPDQRTLVESKVASLRAQAANLRAETTAKCTAIEGQIQQLLCIENSPSAAKPSDIDA
jgi:hypothetical protein